MAKDMIHAWKVALLTITVNTTSSPIIIGVTATQHVIKEDQHTQVGRHFKKLNNVLMESITIMRL